MVGLEVVVQPRTILSTNWRRISNLLVSVKIVTGNSVGVTKREPFPDVILKGMISTSGGYQNRNPPKMQTANGSTRTRTNIAKESPFFPHSHTLGTVRNALSNRLHVHLQSKIRTAKWNGKTRTRN